ncbi:MAG: hypothetical protein WCH61_05645 [bacterium]
MIELYTENFLVEENGRHVSLDVERLRADVREASVTAGMTDGWLADHTLWVIEDYFLARRRQDAGVGITAAPPPPRREEVDRAVARVLAGAGYGDVAEAFSRRRQGVTGENALDAEVGSGQIPWDRSRLEAVLEELAPFSREKLNLLVHRVETALLKLGLPRVTDLLIRHLGQHLQMSSSAPLPAPRRESPWLLGPEFWRGRLPAPACGDEPGRPWVIPHPVSRLSPTVRVTFNLAAVLPGDLAGVPLTELAFWPQLGRAVAGLRDVMVAMHRDLLAAVPVAGGRPLRVDVCGLSSVTLALELEKTPARGRRLATELRRFLQERIPDLEGTPVMMQFTNDGRNQ